MPRCFGMLCLVSLVLASPTRGWAQVAAIAAPAADPYVPAALVSGPLSLSGSRTMSQLAAVWSDGFRHLHPEVTAKLDFLGSETAFANLAGDGAVIGLLSRSLTPAEQEAYAKAQAGSKLIAVEAAVDAIAVVVAPDHPLDSLTLPQLKLLFARREQPVTWGEVGLEGEWKDVPVVRFAPDENSGARSQFNAQVLGESAQPADVTAHSWHTQIVEDVAQTKGAIGFVSAANARTDKVRTLSIAAADGAPAVALDPAAVSSGDYPLVRPLTLVVVADANGVRNPLVAEFLRYVLSQSGQADVVKDGFQPLDRSHLLQQYERLGWNQVK